MRKVFPVMLISVLILLALASLCPAQTTGIHPDLQAALDSANKAGKLLLVDFYGDWCGWCKKLDETMADKDVKALMNEKFYYYKLDIGKFDQHVECFKQYKVQGIPMIIVFDAKGNVQATCEGYKDAAGFRIFLTDAQKSAPPAPVAPVGINADMKPALDSANKAGKILLVDFYGDWCGWCKKLDETMADKDVKAMMDEKFYYYKFDIGKFDKHVECIKQYQVRGIPLVLAFDAKGNVKATCDGYKDVEGFKAFLTEAAKPAAAPPAGIHPDLQAALNDANKTNKLLLVDFYGDWCPWCKKMDETLANAEVKKLMEEKYLYFKLDIGKFDQHTECFKQYKVEGIPMIIVFDAKGNVKATSEGYKIVPLFQAFLIDTAKPEK